MFAEDKSDSGSYCLLGPGDVDCPDVHADTGLRAPVQVWVSVGGIKLCSCLAGGGRPDAGFRGCVSGQQ